MDIKAGGPYQTKGSKAKVIILSTKGPHLAGPVIGHFEGECDIRFWSKEGISLASHMWDLEEAPKVVTHTRWVNIYKDRIGVFHKLKGSAVGCAGTDCIKVAHKIIIEVEATNA